MTSASNASGPRTPAAFPTHRRPRNSRAMTGLIAVCQTTAWLPYSRIVCLVVGDVVEVGAARDCHPCRSPCTWVPAHVFPGHSLAEGRRIRQHGRDEVSGCDVRTRRPRTALSSPARAGAGCARSSMKSSPSPYLNVTRPQSISRGNEHDLLVLDVYALDRVRSPRGSRTPLARRRARLCTSHALAPRPVAGSGTPRSSSRSKRSERMHGPGRRCSSRREPRSRRSR